MTTHPTITIIDGPTGNVTVREMTDAEAANHQAVIDDIENENNQRIARETANATARSSARAKLKALGLTDDEIAAFLA